MAYLTECPERPLLAIVGGESLESRLKLIDGLLDLVDILAIGGGLAATFIAATNMNRGQDVAFNGGGGERRKRKTKWGPGTAGAPRDLLDVLEVARRLLVKARKRGVEVGGGGQRMQRRGVEWGLYDESYGAGRFGVALLVRKISISLDL